MGSDRTNFALQPCPCCSRDEGKCVFLERLLNLELLLGELQVTQASHTITVRQSSETARSQGFCDTDTALHL